MVQIEKPITTLLLLFAIVTPGYGEPVDDKSNPEVSQVPSGKPSPEIISGVTGDLAIPPAAAAAGVYVEFQNSPTLTDAIRRSLAERGMRVLDAPGEGAATVSIKGTYSATRGTYQSFQGDVGQLVVTFRR